MDGQVTSLLQPRPWLCLLAAIAGYASTFNSHGPLINQILGIHLILLSGQGLLILNNLENI